MKIYCLVSNNGDGSGSAQWFRDASIAESLIDEDPETWGGNDGGPTAYTFPEGFDFDACGIHFSDDDYPTEGSCDHCRDGDHWPAGVDVWVCPECDAEYY